MQIRKPIKATKAGEKEIGERNVFILFTVALSTASTAGYMLGAYLDKDVVRDPQTQMHNSGALTEGNRTTPRVKKSVRINKSATNQSMSGKASVYGTATEKGPLSLSKENGLAMIKRS